MDSTKLVRSGHKTNVWLGFPCDELCEMMICAHIKETGRNADICSEWHWCAKERFWITGSDKPITLSQEHIDEYAAKYWGLKEHGGMLPSMVILMTEPNWWSLDSSAIKYRFEPNT